MLVLTRKQQQQIQIGEGVTITILKVKGNTVRIGIEAPSDVKIVRSELEPEEEAAPAEEAEPQAAAPRIDQMESVSLGGKPKGNEDYRVISFRLNPEAEAKNQNNSPRAASMREFIAARAANSVG
ncbi:carbon storage regulator [Bremerella cremea]|uniref:carbon storage regulator n=1 Tax=Bremerella cremea TaxID=1031537 RepID=UPI0031F0A4B5